MEFNQLGMAASALATACFLVVVVERVVEGLAAPLRRRWPEVNFWWLVYVAWVVGGVVVWLSGVNLFAGLVVDVVVGRVLSAVVAGGGANLLHDLFDGGG